MIPMCMRKQPSSNGNIFRLARLLTKKLIQFIGLFVIAFWPATINQEERIIAKPVDIRHSFCHFFTAEFQLRKKRVNFFLIYIFRTGCRKCGFGFRNNTSTLIMLRIVHSKRRMIFRISRIQIAIVYNIVRILYIAVIFQAFQIREKHFFCCIFQNVCYRRIRTFF